MWKTHTQFIHMDYLFIILYKHNNIHFVSTLVHSWHIEHHASCLFILYIFFSPCHTEIVTVRHFPHTQTHTHTRFWNGQMCCQWFNIISKFVCFSVIEEPCSCIRVSWQESVCISNSVRRWRRYKCSILFGACVCVYWNEKMLKKWEKNYYEYDFFIFRRNVYLWTENGSEKNISNR